jgi:hypothetical protein
VRIGGHHQPVTPRNGRQVEQRAVVALAQRRVVEGAGKQLLDQLQAGAAAGAVVHVDPTLLQIERADVIRLAHAEAPTTGMSRNRP